MFRPSVNTGLTQHESFSRCYGIPVTIYSFISYFCYVSVFHHGANALKKIEMPVCNDCLIIVKRVEEYDRWD